MKDGKEVVLSAPSEQQLSFVVRPCFRRGFTTNQLSTLSAQNQDIEVSEFGLYPIRALDLLAEMSFKKLCISAYFHYGCALRCVALRSER